MISAIPGSPLVNPAQRLVKLYFIGADLVEHVKKQGDDREVVVVAKGRDWTMPPLGEYIEVSEVLAKDLIDASIWAGEPTLIREDQGGARLAKTLKEAISQGGGKLSVEAIQKAKATQALSDLTTEDLIAVLKERGIALPSAQDDDKPIASTDAPKIVKKKAEDV